MRSNLKTGWNWWVEWLDSNTYLDVMQWSVYVFVILMYAGALGTIKAIAFYVPASLWTIRLILKKEAGFQWKDPLFILILLLTLSAIVSSLFSVNQAASLISVKKSYLKVVFLYCIIATIFSDSTVLKRLSFVMACAGIAYVVFTFFELGRYLIKEGRIDYLKIRYFSTIMLFFFPFVFLRYIEGQGRKRVLWGIPTLASVIGLVVISVRASWLAMIVVVAIWMYFLRTLFFKRFNIVPTTLIVTGLLIVTFLLFPSQYRLIRGHMSETIQMTLRFAQWNVVLSMSKESLIYGHGFNERDATANYLKTFNQLYGRYPTKIEPTTAHNQLLTILYQHGIIGLVLYAYMIWLALSKLFKRIISDGISSGSYVGIAIFSAIVGEYVLRTMFEDRNLIPLGVLLGMTGAFTSDMRK
ncbi:MAG: O-antigen ligase family protein [Nitrospirae bacterium]|nr:O-antigen ligase family protein [Nitrospirota bacterium]